MNKLLFNFVFIFFSTCVFGQNYFKAVSVVFGYEKDSNKEEIVWSEKRESSVDITIKGNTISFDDKGQTSYILYGKRGELKGKNLIVYTWKARDEKGKSCVVTLNYFQGVEGMDIIIIYKYKPSNEPVVIKYHTKRNVIK